MKNIPQETAESVEQTEICEMSITNTVLHFKKMVLFWPAEPLLLMFLFSTLNFQP